MVSLSLRCALLLLAGALAAPAFAQTVEPTNSVVPPGAELQLGLDARTLYTDATFDALMDLVEASSSYQAHAEQLAAWGFDPREDVQEVVFAVDRFGAADAEFVIVATGTLSADEMNVRLGEQAAVTRTENTLGPIWTDERGTSLLVTDTVAIAGVGAMFEHALQAVSDGVQRATDGAPATVWLRLDASDEVRAQHPALRDLLTVTAMVEVDATPAFRVRAIVADDATAGAAAEELRHLLEAAAAVPEVSALRIERLVSDAVVVVNGSEVSLDTEIDTATWTRFSSMLSDLIAEELR